MDERTRGVGEVVDRNESREEQGTTFDRNDTNGGNVTGTQGTEEFSRAAIPPLDLSKIENPVKPDPRGASAATASQTATPRTARTHRSNSGATMQCVAGLAMAGIALISYNVFLRRRQP